MMQPLPCARSAILTAATAVIMAAAFAPCLSCSSASVQQASDGGPDVTLIDPSFAWSPAAPCPTPRFEANGVLVGGELWVMGGFVSAALDVTNGVDIYDPATDAWRAGPDLPGAQTHVGVVGVGNDVVVVGGFRGKFGSARAPAAAEVWRWRSLDGLWSPGPSLPKASAAFAWGLIGSVLHIAGGLGADGGTDTSAHLIWDLAGAEAWVVAPPLPNPRNHGGGAVVDGLFYALAGRHAWNETAGDQTDVNAFDPSTGLWKARAPIPIARSEIAASTSAMSDGRILVVGGSLAGIRPSADVLIYDPGVDTWARLPALPEPRKGTVAVRVGPRIVVTTGSPTSVDPSGTTWVGCCL